MKSEGKRSNYGFMYNKKKKKSETREGKRLRECTLKRKIREEEESHWSWIKEASMSSVSTGPDHWAHDSGPVLYIRTHIKKPYLSSQWYLIPPQDLEIEPHLKDNNNKKRKRKNQSPPGPPLSPVLGKMMPRDILVHSVAVALLPRIYVLGGGFSYGQGPSRQVFSYDITAPHKGWERRPNLICGRISPSAVALEGKIYVFGGMDYPQEDMYTDKEIMPYAEVYDPESDKWEAVFGGGGGVMHPFVCPGHAVLVDQHQNKNLLVRTRCPDTFYTYNISANSFTPRERNPFHYRGEAGAEVDGILYTYSLNCIIAYDLTKGEWFDEPVHGLSHGTLLPVSSAVRVFLLHIGNGRLCIVYASPYFDRGVITKDLMLTCSVVRVSRRVVGGKTILRASLESFKRYVVPGTELQDCLVL